MPPASYEIELHDCNISPYTTVGMTKGAPRQAAAPCSADDRRAAVSWSSSMQARHLLVAHWMTSSPATSGRARRDPSRSSGDASSWQTGRPSIFPWELRCPSRPSVSVCAPSLPPSRPASPRRTRRLSWARTAARRSFGPADPDWRRRLSWRRSQSRPTRAMPVTMPMQQPPMRSVACSCSPPVPCSRSTSPAAALRARGGESRSESSLSLSTLDEARPPRHRPTSYIAVGVCRFGCPTHPFRPVALPRRMIRGSSNPNGGNQCQQRN